MIAMLAVGIPTAIVLAQYGYWALNQNIAASNTNLTFAMSSAKTRTEVRAAATDASTDRWIVSGFYARPFRWILTNENKALSPQVLDLVDIVNERPAKRMENALTENSTKRDAGVAAFLLQIQQLAAEFTDIGLKVPLLDLNRSSISHAKYCKDQAWVKLWYNWVVQRRLATNSNREKETQP